MKIAHFLTDLVAALTGRLFFLMIKAQPEGQCSDVRHWYEHISLTFILTAEAKYCSPKCKSLKKSTFECFITAADEDFDWFLQGCVFITLSLLIKYVLKVQFKDLFFFFFLLFFFSFFISRSSWLFQHKPTWINSSQLSRQSLLLVCVSHLLPCQLRILLEDCKNLSRCAALCTIYLEIPNKASAADAAFW